MTAAAAPVPPALIEAAYTGARYGAFDGRYQPLAETALRTVGPAIGAYLWPGERVGIFVPVQVLARGQISQGGVAFTADRVVVAWHETGLTYAETFVVTCPLAEVRDVARGVRETPLSPTLAKVTFWADTQYLELIFATAVGAHLVTTVQRILAREVALDPPDAPSHLGRRAFGITFDSLRHARGALVAAVAPGSEADAAGVVPGVVLTHVAGRRVEEATHARAVLASVLDEPAVELRWWRDGVVTTGWCEYRPPAGEPPAAPAATAAPTAPPVDSAPDPDRQEFDRAIGLAQAWPAGDLGARMNPDDVRAASAVVLEAFGRGDFETAWRRRLELGHVVPVAGVELAVVFWLDAAAALAALHLGLRDHPLVATLCGVAESHADRADPGQTVVVREFTQLSTAAPPADVGSRR